MRTNRRDRIISKRWETIDPGTMAFVALKSVRAPYTLNKYLLFISMVDKRNCWRTCTRINGLHGLFHFTLPIELCDANASENFLLPQTFCFVHTTNVCLAGLILGT
jgi:hypothetical protein